MTSPTLTVELYPSDYAAKVADLTASFDRGWQDQLNDTGSFSLSLPNDAAAAPDATRARIVRFLLDGTAAWSGIVEQRKRHSVAAGEEHDQITEISGRGTLAAWERLVVYPEQGVGWEPFADNRLFTFAAVGFDDSGWAAAVTTPDTTGSHDNYGDIVDWPDSDAAWIWDRSNDGTGVYSPGGDVYFRKAFTTASRLMVELRGAADDAFEAYVDGVQVLTGGPVYFGTSTSSEPFALAAGSHVLAVKATNANALKAGLRMTLRPVKSDGSYDTPIVRTDATWLQVGYPTTPPGFTPGAIIRVLLEEAQARASVGPVGAMTLNFTDSVDSDGTAWPVSPDVAFTVGLDGLSALKQLAEVYVDVAMAAGTLQLSAFVHGGRGQSRPAAVFTAGSNLTELVHEDVP